MVVAIDDQTEDIWVDRYFRDHWGRLTQGRIEAIEDTLLDELVVTEQHSYSGNTNYTVDNDCMASRLSAAKKAI